MNDAPLRPRLEDAPPEMGWRLAVGWRLGALFIIAVSCVQAGSISLLIVAVPLVSQLVVVMLLRWKWRPADVLTPAQRLTTAMAGLASQVVPLIIGLAAWVWPGNPHRAYGYVLLLWSGLVLMASLAGCNSATWRLLRLIHDLDPASRKRHKYVVTVSWLGSAISFMVVRDGIVPLRAKLAMLVTMLVAGLLTVRLWDPRDQPSSPEATAQPAAGTRLVDRAVSLYFWLSLLGAAVLWLIPRT